ncbi:galactokinase [Flavobacterium turcicum]|uniref:Galactokinase n=1 Tax=Flavobacterium turcicum TaxID=2764718 RepID=A0ABR7JBD2_9FLAO|nr:galactokinase [Flavobacterium turcicum]MBC5861792.1 galactokinase [Flavobacterium turcicum]NHL00523.1 galactokinase [Flavobacterium turcicum]
MNDVVIQKTSAFFQEKFGSTPEKVVLSPGRINIIGEHIDYNDGYVLPAAIDKIICFAFAKNNSNESKIIALDLNEELVVDLSADVSYSKIEWTNYLLGVIKQLQDNGFNFEGFNCVFSSNIPVGSGLSSSAALECGFLYGINSLFDLQIKPIDMALMGQKAEHWVGINCGIMDQFSSVMGLENKVIKIDCKTLEYEYHTADFNDYALILFDSNVKHSLMTSAYNQRREQCEEGLSLLKNKFPEINSFRDCRLKHVHELKDVMSADVFKRCSFVVKEIERVTLACTALDNGAIETLGQLMFETHEGLSQEYEVSCNELDFLVDFVKNEKAVVGSRLMGGGFGGCTINLIKKGEEDAIKTKLVEGYKATFGIDLKIYDVKIGNGTSLYEPLKH